MEIVPFLPENLEGKKMHEVFDLTSGRGLVMTKEARGFHSLERWHVFGGMRLVEHKRKKTGQALLLR